MILVDTSVWIDYLKVRPGAGAAQLDILNNAGIPFALTPIILQEILQGTRSAGEFQNIHKVLITQNFLFPRDAAESYAAAAEIYARCRWAGITLRSTIVCLIAQIAIENNAQLLHNDVDFDRIATVIKTLQIF